MTLAGLSLLPPTGGITTDVAAVDFGTMIEGDSKVMHVLLENAGTTTVTLGARTVTTPFQYLSDNCSATLTSARARSTCNLPRPTSGILLARPPSPRVPTL